jgi:hypothetical protein
MENVRICCSRWVGMVLMENLTKSECLLYETGGSDRKSECISFEMSFEMNCADEKSEHLSLKMNILLMKNLSVCSPSGILIRSVTLFSLLILYCDIEYGIKYLKFSLSIVRFYYLISKYGRVALVPKSGSSVLRKLF